MTIFSRILAKLVSRGVPSRTEILIGKIGIVTQAIHPDAEAGRVMVMDEDWAARSPAAIPADSTVRVTGADGITLIVTPVDGEIIPPRSLS